jgi:hypothetical protein
MPVLHAGELGGDLLVASNAGVQDRHARLVRALTDDVLTALRAHGCALDRKQIETLLAADLELNAQGLEVWIDQQRQ